MWAAAAAVHMSAAAVCTCDAVFGTCKYVNNDMMPPSHAVMFYIHPQQWSYLPQPFWLNVHNIDDIGYSCPTKCENFGREEFHSVE